MLEQQSCGPARTPGDREPSVLRQWGPPWDKAAATKFKLKILLSEREVLGSIPSQRVTLKNTF